MDRLKDLARPKGNIVRLNYSAGPGGKESPEKKNEAPKDVEVPWCERGSELKSAEKNLYKKNENRGKGVRKMFELTRRWAQTGHETSSQALRREKRGGEKGGGALPLKKGPSRGEFEERGSQSKEVCNGSRRMLRREKESNHKGGHSERTKYAPTKKTTIALLDSEEKGTGTGKEKARHRPLGKPDAEKIPSGTTQTHLAREGRGNGSPQTLKESFRQGGGGEEFEVAAVYRCGGPMSQGRAKGSGNLRGGKGRRRHTSPLSKKTLRTQELNSGKNNECVK